MLIERVYHWTDIKNKESILKEGIKIYSFSFEYINDVTKEKEVFNAPYICTSPRPSLAYGYVVPALNNEVEKMALFEIRLVAEDHIHVRNDGLNQIIEIRIDNSIPADRVWFVGERSVELI